ncbi:MAG: LysM peptidoglycan-binding domain-containing protein, partial [Acidimicrobiia bacterium]
TGPPASVSPPTTPLPAPGPPPAPVEAAPAVHVIAPGESLWTIAAAQVAPEADVAPYWAQVVEANRATLRSGNPNLIYPGEVVELPRPG